MSTLRKLAEKVLATAVLNRCSHGYDDEEGEYRQGACEAGATHTITGPHDQPGGQYCKAHAQEVHAGIEYNHRWSLSEIDGTQGLIAARRLAEAVLKAEAAK